MQSGRGHDPAKPGSLSLWPFAGVATQPGRRAGRPRPLGSAGSPPAGVTAPAGSKALGHGCCHRSARPARPQPGSCAEPPPPAPPAPALALLPLCGRRAAGAVGPFLPVPAPPLCLPATRLTDPETDPSLCRAPSCHRGPFVVLCHGPRTTQEAARTPRAHTGRLRDPSRTNTAWSNHCPCFNTIGFPPDQRYPSPSTFR